MKQIKFTARQAIIFTLVNSIFLILLGNIFIRISVFLACAAILYYLGKIPYVDIDPVPFAAGLMLVWYGLPTALQFIVWTIPAADVLAGRFNFYSLSHLFSLTVALIAAYFLPSVVLSLVAVVVLFNAVRTLVLFFMGITMGNIISQSVHLVLYVSLAIGFSPLIEAGKSLINSLAWY